VGGVYDISSIVENYVLGITQQTGGVGTQLWCWDTPWWHGILGTARILVHYWTRDTSDVHLL